ncbi:MULTISPECIES: RRXRR domain-containing protein [Acidithiobacillus]|uniref:HNH nuclease domain-containing protein n=2 Tax=Acidithiobacillus TaxID=119977 RepID=A0A179BPJ5_ACIFR|nr:MULTISPECIES: RRXRR domain-containing protein [Acidithiobacillus]MEB8488164.1 RRXRR domain-containing protein [Acidithiobacillus ferriphilus]MEB8488750.1 RRXRR domain-containing protein [Acidithiobacillus ferriphilus]MEB8492194.1 RRXRR domain-containing protein [Acidithiobacillus ferriphilus]MEB8513498.1 RRXRR domain-containing protein [Acidithiobacillus ferriphilus]MEB8520393.1 RRXRR domain-containing protein [Acidithiobacillus ferriphilus]
MLVFVMDQYDRPGHPTRRLDWVRKQVKRKWAKIVGGGISGKPAVLVLRERSFDRSKTVKRRFFAALDTGFLNVGYAVTELLADGTLGVLLKGTLNARTPDIRGLMDERRMYRRARRYHRRLNVKKKGQTPKSRPPRYESRGKRDSVTLRHGLETHVNLYARLARLAPLPDHQVRRGFESVSFDLRALAYGKPRTGSGYQVSPVGKATGEKVRTFVVRRDGGCIVCGSTEHLHDHHLRKRSQQGSNRANNQVTLCDNCHDDVHAGLIELPITDGAQWRDASMVNAVCGKLRKLARDLDLTPVPVEQSVAARRRLAMVKTHALDAVSVAVAMTDAAAVDYRDTLDMDMAQYRRHRRARIHAQRDRLYYLPGDKKPVAHNRRKRSDQGDVDSLAEFRRAHPQDMGRLKVKKAVRLYTPNRAKAPAVGGDVWNIGGRRVVAQGVHSKTNLYVPDLKRVTGKVYASPKDGVRLFWNSGMVVA